MVKWNNLDPKTRKIVIEVLILLILLVAALVFFIVTADTAEEADLSEPTSGIQTQFNTEAIEYVRNGIEQERPFLSDDAGTPNPFTF